MKFEHPIERVIESLCNWNGWCQLCRRWIVCKCCHGFILLVKRDAIYGLSAGWLSCDCYEDCDWCVSIALLLVDSN